MNIEKIPVIFYLFIPLIEEWGIYDDWERNEKIRGLDRKDLQLLAQSLDNEQGDTLLEWLAEKSEDLELSCSEEYINISCFAMAYEYAKVRLKD
jgi:hypothetical protein